MHRCLLFTSSPVAPAAGTRATLTWWLGALWPQTPPGWLERLAVTSLTCGLPSALGKHLFSRAPARAVLCSLPGYPDFIVFLPTAFQSTWKLDAISKSTDWLAVWDIVFSLAPKNAVVRPKIQSPRNHTWFTTQLFDNIKSICNILKSLANYF